MSIPSERDAMQLLMLRSIFTDWWFCIVQGIWIARFEEAANTTAFAPSASGLLHGIYAVQPESRDRIAELFRESF